MIDTNYVSYPLALALKKVGFDYPCCFYYTRKDAPDDHVWSTTSEEAPIDYNRSVYAECSMPTLAQAQKWLRDMKRLSIEPYANIAVAWNYNIADLDNFAENVGGKASFSSYKSALSAGIAAALELIEKEGE